MLCLRLWLHVPAYYALVCFIHASSTRVHARPLFVCTLTLSAVLVAATFAALVIVSAHGNSAVLRAREAELVEWCVCSPICPELAFAGVTSAPLLTCAG